MENKNIPSIKPMEGYEAPKVPTLEEVRKNPAPLKKLPGRWAKNAAVVACVGILGVSALAGCMPNPSTAGQYYDENGETAYGNGNGYPVLYSGYEKNEYDVRNTYYEEFDLISFRLHNGGAGGASYIVYQTEQEVLGIIRAQLEAAGLNFSDVPPNHIVSLGVGLNLFDAENNVAVALFGGSTLSDEQRSRRVEYAAIDFASQTDINIGAFYTPGYVVGAFGGWQWWNLEEPEDGDGQLELRQRELRANLVEGVTAQTQEFINFLRAEGIL